MGCFRRCCTFLHGTRMGVIPRISTKHAFRSFYLLGEIWAGGTTKVNYA